MLLVKEDRKSSQLNTRNNQILTILTTNMKNPLNRRKHEQYRVREHMRKQPSLTNFYIFRRSTSKRLNYYILPTLQEDQSDVILLHIGSNDINNQTKDKINTKKLTKDITNIGKSLGVKEVIISSSLPKNIIAVTSLIR